MSYTKAIVYACIDLEGYTYDEHFGISKEVMTPVAATANFKKGCNNVIDYCAKFGKVDVEVEDHVNMINKNMYIYEVSFFVDDGYAGYVTMSMYNN